MRTQEVIRKIRWIDEQFAEPLQVWLFSKQGPTAEALSMIHDASRVAELLSRDADAAQVLNAFGLDALVQRDALVDLLQWLLSPDRLSSKEHPEGKDSPRGAPPTHPVAHKWRAMIGCASPLELLTTPEELLVPQASEEHITFRIADVSTDTIPLAHLAKATSLADEVYETISRVYRIDGAGSLNVIKIESGSDITIDCKGLGEPIKHVKDFILEAWQKVRHKRADEVLENSKAVLGSLEAIGQINAHERDGSLSREEAEQLRRRLLSAVCNLFECGALIAEIPIQENVENRKLLTGFAPRQLPPATPETVAVARDAARKAQTARKQKARQR